MVLFLCFSAWSFRLDMNSNLQLCSAEPEHGGGHCEAQCLTSNVVFKQNKHLAVPKSKSKNTRVQLVDIYFLGLSNNIQLFPTFFKKKTREQ